MYVIYIECSDLSSTAFIDPLPVIEFVAQVLGKDVLSRPLSDADRIKVYIRGRVILDYTTTVPCFSTSGL